MLSLAKFIDDSCGKFLTVTFVKKNGEIRVLNGRLGVTKHLKGGKCTLDKSKFIIIYDQQNAGYRSINRESILSVSCQGVVITQKGE
jgi:hypothetical protein